MAENYVPVKYVRITKSFEVWFSGRTEYSTDDLPAMFADAVPCHDPPFVVDPPLVAYRHPDLPGLYLLVAIRGDTANLVIGRGEPRHTPKPCDVVWPAYPADQSLDQREAWVKMQLADAQVLFESNRGQHGVLHRAAAIKRSAELKVLQRQIGAERQAKQNAQRPDIDRGVDKEHGETRQWMERKAIEAITTPLTAALFVAQMLLEFKSHTHRRQGKQTATRGESRAD